MVTGFGTCGIEELEITRSQMNNILMIFLHGHMCAFHRYLGMIQENINGVYAKDP